MNEQDLTQVIEKSKIVNVQATQEHQKWQQVLPYPVTAIITDRTIEKQLHQIRSLSLAPDVRMRVTAEGKEITGEARVELARAIAAQPGDFVVLITNTAPLRVEVLHPNIEADQRRLDLTFYGTTAQQKLKELREQALDKLRARLKRNDQLTLAHETDEGKQLVEKLDRSLSQIAEQRGVKIKDYQQAVIGFPGTRATLQTTEGEIYVDVPSEDIYWHTRIPIGEGVHRSLQNDYEVPIIERLTFDEYGIGITEGREGLIRTRHDYTTPDFATARANSGIANLGAKPVPINVFMVQEAINILNT